MGREEKEKEREGGLKRRAAEERGEVGNLSLEPVLRG